MKHLIFVLLLLLNGQVLAEELKEFDFDVPSAAMQDRGVKPECKFEGVTIPEDAIIYAAGGYSGRKLDFQIDQSGHTATQFDIAINSKTRPVILILGAYEPTIWNLGWSSGTKILAVFASGYHRQVIAGLGSETPTLISSYDNKGPCGYFYVGKEKNVQLNPQSRQLFGKPVNLVYQGDKSGKIVVGDPLTNTEKLTTSKKNTPESYRDQSAPLAGKAGLDDAEAKGIIRRATVADANQWVEEVFANSPKQDVPPIAGQGIPKPRRPHLHNAYVVLKEFTYPAGLYGGNSASFFVTKGVPIPKGNPGHSTIYDFNSLLCNGVGCGR
ncbi:hypothetical protein JWJ90_21705 [Desulfobulbus rhabdoformis]|uniref:hypothetical protein n=1 Tax=Desulfobulbus rhabdoformis TaxID=34032 RepID=UPI001963225C|nr:hypothetical protein [Desulfobulbus rhabdoformis]MBM9616882.1 hypothetical protein [Desulfobulbus rhabdoformis]